MSFERANLQLADVSVWVAKYEGYVRLFMKSRAKENLYAAPETYAALETRKSTYLHTTVSLFCLYCSPLFHCFENMNT